MDLTYKHMATYEIFKFDFRKSGQGQLFSKENGRSTLDDAQRIFGEILKEPLVITKQKRGDEVAHLENYVERRDGDILSMVVCNEKDINYRERKEEVTLTTHPGCRVIVDNRPGVGQMAIERDSSFNGKPGTVRDLLQAINTYRGLSEKMRTEIFALREKNGFLHPETCKRERLIATYKDFAPYFDAKYKRLKGRLRYVDFNQGVDARLFNEDIVSLLEQIPVRPLRIAFDNVKTEAKYRKAIKLSEKHGMRDFSNYLLYNFTDKPIDLYHRLRINVDMCETMNVSIYSFPMKYHPIQGEHSHDRDYIGKHWNRKYIRAVQAILNATKGKIGRGVSFFEKAFGRNEEEYMELLLMPETFLLFRFFFEDLGYTQEWRDAMAELSDEEREELLPIIYRNEFNHIEELTDNPTFRHILAFYKDYRKDIADHSSELYKLKQKFEKRQKEKQEKT